MAIVQLPSPALFAAGIEAVTLLHDVLGHLRADAAHGRQRRGRRRQHRLRRAQRLHQRAHPHRTDALDPVQRDVCLARRHENSKSILLTQRFTKIHRDSSFQTR